MKPEINQILMFAICADETHRIRNAVALLDSTEPDGLQRMIEQLDDVIATSDLGNHDLVGMYNFFLACLYYERDEYMVAAQKIRTALVGIWDSAVNKALANWLLGLCLAGLLDFARARRELQQALHLLEIRTHINSPELDHELRMRNEIRLEINEVLEHWSNEPLFRTVQPDPVHRENNFPIQDPPADDEEGTSVALNIPIRISNENRPVNNVNMPVNISNENYPVNKVNIQLPAEKRPSSDDEPIENETRTDAEGYMVLYEQPIYGNVRAGRSGEPWEFEVSTEHPEIDTIIFEGRPHNLHSLHASAQINLTNGDRWGWMKVKGHSMNNMKGRVPIQDGDYVLVKKQSTARENDIVVAWLQDKTTGDSITVVKRFKGRNRLVSETHETGPEYEAIIMDKNVHIHGIVYAVAKPISQS